MKFNIAETKPVNQYDGKWHKKFIIWPRRIDQETIAWLETVERRYVIDCEGNWAGGFVFHWEYRSFKNGKEVIWKTPPVHD